MVLLGDDVFMFLMFFVGGVGVILVMVNVEFVCVGVIVYLVL